MSLNTAKQTVSGLATYGFNDDPNTGLHSSAADTLDLLAGGNTVASVASDEKLMKTTSTTAVEFFMETVTLTSAAAATAVPILSESRVGSGRKVYLMGFISKNDGTTAWGTTATVKIQDTNGTPVDFVTVAVAALTNSAKVGPWTSNVTLEDAYSEGSGGTAGKGLQLKGDANGTGSDYKVTVWGVIK